jgi:hypothetical protein
LSFVDLNACDAGMGGTRHENGNHHRANGSSKGQMHEFLLPVSFEG